ncbi:TPA: helix-turn-helix domain-containing protein [Streptococcus suis]
MKDAKLLYIELQRLREAKQITQSSIANQLGFNTSSISHVEIGQKNLSVVALLNWMNILDINLVSIVSDANKGIDYNLIHKAIDSGIDVNTVIKRELEKQ